MLDDVPELESLDRLLDAAEALSGLELRRSRADGPTEDLADTRVAQPLLYLADWAWGVTLLESGVEPVAVAGHSLGELAALAVAGVFSPEAGLELVVERSKLMAAAAAAHPGTMSAVLGLDGAAIADGDRRHRRACGSPTTTRSGRSSSPARCRASSSATEALRAAGARRVVPLAVSGAFHSPLMESAADGVRRPARRRRVRRRADSRLPEHRPHARRPTASAIRDRLDRADHLAGPLDRDHGGTRC